jgi:hypothetical protein
VTHPQTEPGEIVFRIKDGRVEITRADPVVVCPGDWLDRVVNWGIGQWPTPLAHSPGYDPAKAHITIVSFADGRRTWTYEITGHDVERDTYTLRWPD